MVDDEARDFFFDVLQKFSSAIGRIVVNKENVGAKWQRSEFTGHSRRVVALIVGGNKKEDFSHFGRFRVNQGSSV